MRLEYVPPREGDVRIAPYLVKGKTLAFVAVSYFDANGQFMSANVRGVPADAGTVTLRLSAGARKACVMLFDGANRPLCGRFDANID